MAGSEEEPALSTVKTLAAAASPAARRGMIIDGRGAHFDILAGRPDLLDAIAGFLVDALVSPDGPGCGGSG